MHTSKGMDNIMDPLLAMYVFRLSELEDLKANGLIVRDGQGVLMFTTQKSMVSSLNGPVGDQFKRNDRLCVALMNLTGLQWQRVSPGRVAAYQNVPIERIQLAVEQGTQEPVSPFKMAKMRCEFK